MNVPGREVDVVPGQRPELGGAQAGQHGGDYLQACGIGDTQPPYEPGYGPLALHPLGYDLAPAVDHGYPIALLLQIDQVLQGGVMAAQGAAADLYHYGSRGLAVFHYRRFVHR